MPSRRDKPPEPQPAAAAQLPAPPPAATTRRAVVDIGTNSVKLLVADVQGAAVNPVLERSKQTRLGSGFYDTHRLQPEAIERTAQAVAAFASAAADLGAATTRVIATSAARDAVNGSDLGDAVRQACGLAMEVISGEQEAAWAHAGVTTDERFAGRPLLILDVGGGSTEFILTDGISRRFAASHPLGTLRWLERFPHADPPTAAEHARCLEQIRDLLDRTVSPELAPAMAEIRPGVQLVGTGGTTTILARIVNEMDDFDRSRIEATRLTRAEVAALGRRLWSLPLAERRQIRGLPANRADVILAGVGIYEAIMACYGLDVLQISTRGLRHAALL